MPSLWLVDGSHAIFRAYHALPHLSVHAGPYAGTSTHAVLGFTNMLLRAIREGQPTHLAVAFDEEAKAKRAEIYPEYKGTRGPPPEDLTPQFPLVRKVLEVLRVPAIGFRGYEADDVIATLARRARKLGWDVVIVTGDKDLMQLVEPGGNGIRCYDSMYEKWYGPAEVKEKWGVGPEKIGDLLALTGDKVDNIPGVPGVGEKTAAALLDEHGTLEAVLAAAPGIKKPKLRENLMASIEKVRLGRQLISLFEDLPLDTQLDTLERKALDELGARKLFTDLEFVRLLKDLPRPPPTPPTGARRTAQTVAEVDELVARARKAGKVGLYVVTSAGAPLHDELLGASVSLPDLEGAPAESVYVPLAGPPLHTQGGLLDQRPAVIERKAALQALRPLLEDPAVTKDGPDLKGAIEAFQRAGVRLDGLGLDPRLASYLLDPTGREHELILSARERIHCELPDLKELSERSGKGKKATPLNALPLEDLGPAANALAEGSRTLAAALAADLAEEPELQKLYDELELPLSRLLADLELSGIGLDVAKLQSIDTEVEAQIGSLLKEIHQLAGEEFSPASNQQLAVILYEKLHLPVLKRGKTGPSTDKEVLAELAGSHPIAAKILEHRELTKLKGTYLEALPAALGADKRLHTTFDQAVAATGRLSSINPNLQNIPIRTPVGARIREAFIARPGWKLISADYSQIELRVLAHVSGDQTLRDSFASGEDLHSRVAVETFGVAAADVTRNQRSIAKMINYGIAYGLSSFGLAQRLSLPQAEASDIIEKYFARYAGVKAWLDGTIEEAKRTGMVKTIFGRRRYLPDIASKNMVARNAAERTAVNTPIQGTAADLVKRAMLMVERSLRAAGSQGTMLLQVHDELVLEAPAEEVESVKRLVVAGMSGAADLAVPLVVDVGEGDTWAEAHR